MPAAEFLGKLPSVLGGRTEHASGEPKSFKVSVNRCVGSRDLQSSAAGSWVRGANREMLSSHRSQPFIPISLEKTT